MRELLLLGIVGLLCPVAILYPRIGLYSYTWFALMHPDALAWSVGNWPMSPALAACTLLGAVKEIEQVMIWFRNWICVLLLVLLALFGCSTFMGVAPKLTTDPYGLFVRVCLMALLIPMLIRTREHLRQFTIVVAFSLGFIGLKWGASGLAGGGARFDSSGASGFLADNNCAALAFAMIVPVCWYCRTLVKKNWHKLAYGAMAAGSLMGIVWTHSRGGAISAAVVMLMISARSKQKIMVVVLMVAFTAPAIYLVRDSYVKRMETLENVEEDGSAASRLAYWKAGIRMWEDHPIFGVGFGSTNFMLLLPMYLGRPDAHVAHNTYVQILADSGLPALLVYVILMVSVIVWLNSSARQAARIDPTLRVYPWAIQAALCAFAVGSTFLSRVTFDVYYILLMMAAAWQTVLRQAVHATTASSHGRPAPVTGRIPSYQIPAARQRIAHVR